MNNNIERSRRYPQESLPGGPAMSQHPALHHVQKLAKLMDTQFRIPGTNYRFGLDGLLGLVPGAGDLSTFGVSGYMIWIMAKNGASGNVLARMVVNVVLDALIGSIPILGDLFDFAFKANTRNVRLMEQYYAHGRHRGGAWKIVIPILVFLFLVIVAIIWGVYSLLDRIF